MNKPIVIIAVLSIIAAIAAGCSDGKKLKTQVIDAFDKQAEITDYRFSGQADIAADIAAANPGMPMMNALYGLFADGTVRWKGVSANDPVRFEADFSLQPSGAAKPLQIPLMIKDNKMYAHLPAVNPEGEFFAIDLDELAKLSGQKNPLSPEAVKQSAKLTAAWMKLGFAAMDPAWFSKANESADGENLAVVTATVKPADWSKFISALAEKQDKESDSAGSGSPAAMPFAAWADRLNESELAQPAVISVAIDQAGFVRKVELSLAVNHHTKAGEAKQLKLDLTLQIDDINGHPEFTMDIPTNTRPFSDVLRLLNDSPIKQK